MKINKSIFASIALLCQGVCAVKGSSLDDGMQSDVSEAIEKVRSMTIELLLTDGWCRNIEIDMPAEHNEAVDRFASMTPEECNRIDDDMLVELRYEIARSALPLDKRVLERVGKHREAVVDKAHEESLQQSMFRPWMREAIFRADPNNSTFDDLCTEFSRIRDEEMPGLLRDSEANGGCYMVEALLRADEWCRKMGISMPAEHNKVVNRFASMAHEDRNCIGGEASIELCNEVTRSTLPLYDRILGEVGAHREAVVDKPREELLRELMMSVWGQIAILNMDPSVKEFGDLCEEFARIRDRSMPTLLRYAMTRELLSANGWCRKIGIDMPDEHNDAVDRFASMEPEERNRMTLVELSKLIRSSVLPLYDHVLIVAGAHREAVVDEELEYSIQQSMMGAWIDEAVTSTEPNNRTFVDLCAEFSRIRTRRMPDLLRTRPSKCWSMFRKLLQADGWCRKIGIDMPAEHNDAVKQFASMTSEERRGINDDGLVELSKLIRSSVLPLSNRILGTSTHIEFVLDKNLEGFIQKYMLNLWVRKAIFETDPASSGFNDLYVKFSRITSSKTHDLMLRRLGRRDLRNPNV